MLFIFCSPTEKIDEVECLIEQPSLGRRHHVLTGHGYELLALGVQGYSNIKDLAGSKLEQKFLDLAGVRKLNKEEVQSCLRRATLFLAHLNNIHGELLYYPGFGVHK